MRILALAAATAAATGLLGATAAIASPATVSVTVGPELQLKAVKSLGVREVDSLAKELQTTVEKRLAKTGAYDGARIDLVLVDAKPNHPTFKQLGDTPGLSMRSVSIGGAKIEGRAVAPDGKVTPLRYSYLEPDIRWVRGFSTWTDAEDTFSQFAAELGAGKAPDER
ncbi:MAG TPA: hypothetical protein VFE18_16315 [Phenylobacterium sp.]|jgi:hypothetical protein|uniref:hypothetical protein n=1 Tax=Phenylobacterium sp. TaxID=1871053 RepID=UPI002D3FAE4A|nr:hypothetical protein [Phenylobacterium sp.]HZZ69738.1 hypothetical protein [Phenylobacterium sp.]